jgi:hypothetical protein
MSRECDQLINQIILQGRHRLSEGLKAVCLRSVSLLARNSFKQGGGGRRLSPPLLCLEMKEEDRSSESNGVRFAASTVGPSRGQGNNSTNPKGRAISGVCPIRPSKAISFSSLLRLAHGIPNPERQLKYMNIRHIEECHDRIMTLLGDECCCH